MRTRILVLAALILALESSIATAQSYALPPHLASGSAALVIDRLLADREALSLSADQATRLTLLSTRLHHDRGHPVLAGLDRVPGKSVPRMVQVRTPATEAFRQALSLLTAEQQAKATRLLSSSGR